MYSFVIKTAMFVNKAVLLVSTIPKLGLKNDFVEVVIADPDPNKSSVIINNTFFLIKDLYFFQLYSLSFLSDLISVDTMAFFTSII